MKHLFGIVGSLALVCGQVSAGVVVEMVAGGERTDRIYAQGGMLRMDPSPEQGAEEASIIFRDDTLWIVNHDDKQCQRIDKEGMEKLSAQLNSAMKQMEAQMAQLPPEQREMMQKMMKKRMPGMAGALGDEAPPHRVESGAAEEVGAYSCTSYTMYSGDAKVWEVCAAAESELGAGASEAVEAFQNMSRFAEQLRESFQQGPLAEMVNSPFQAMQEIDGFPVRVRMFGSGGSIEDESTLKSMVQEDLSDDLFAVPAGYKVVNVADQIGKAR